jgi:uncharacterized protein YciI
MHRYLILLMRRPHLDPAVLPLHRAYLEGLREQGQVELYGGFGDKSGGAYVLRAGDMAQATAIAHNDPAHISGGWDLTVHEWLT